ncbi:bifunctional hydroxymethylpyrimidine kinase/phosphomethylpyrimidine kinase [uncultured Dialister sp.]|uniref:bifunctional hydroxymethylpyrimidine kinase/phosphomethylpyrimidine kinase n=1 Tax=uncultured Dialister sp. TaxID=278064 RepID=UPI0025CCB840|nr:bifunctional hydroxymethylpyrimidine kinase/phosphomethylpyrimidine kinase [uncultured Dialister sp.]
MIPVLTIAGSDSSGGAGIQADLKTFAALGTYGMSCICALTAQNTKGVTMVTNTPVDMVRAQLAAIYDDIPPKAVKTGMLSTPEIVETVSDFLISAEKSPLVVDPVMVATSGAVLLEEAAIETYKKKLIPIATLITPNIPEAKVLSGLPIENTEDMKKAAEKLMDYGCRAVLVKGGHLVEDAKDILFDGNQFYSFIGDRVETENTHGTGCTLSSAIAAGMAKGLSLPEAVKEAKKYMEGAIKKAAKDSVGHGHGPVHHFWFYDKWGEMN